MLTGADWEDSDSDERLPPVAAMTPTTTAAMAKIAITIRPTIMPFDNFLPPAAPEAAGALVMIPGVGLPE